jgi:polyvinyl alcohol dehydrogenase (cytochrome)
MNRALAATLYVAMLLLAARPATAAPASDAVSSRAGGAGMSGQKVYATRCALCHDHATGRTPTRTQLQSHNTMEIVRSLTTGLMRSQAVGLKPEELRAVAAFLQSPGTPAASTTAAPGAAGMGLCKDAGPTLRLDGPGWSGWGNGLENGRYQGQPGVNLQELPRLKLKWAFGFPGRGVRGQPTVAGGRLFVASNDGRIYSLDAKSGCTYWTYKSGGSARSAISVGRLPGSPARYGAFFGDDKGFAQAVNAVTGEPLWKVKVESAAGAMVTGAPVLYDGRLYVPLSSSEEMLAGYMPNYECCKFRGSVVALDAASGKLLWQTHTIAEAPKVLRKTADGRNLIGPAGAAIWSTPTIDVKRRLLYVTTGNSYTDAETKGSNAVMAMSLEDGAVKWTRQQTEHDNYLLNCAKGGGNCPDVMGDDFDFGSSPILHALPDGKQLLLAGQKSGILYALDPDRDGELLWKVRLSPGSYLGGIQWGPAADAENVYVAISDVMTPKGGAPGLYALRAATGEKVWSAPAPAAQCSWGTMGCSNGQSAAVTSTPGAVFSGALDGHLRIYASKDGAVLWDYDTARSYDTVNGIKAAGGSLDTGGAAVAGGIVYVTSGHAMLAGHAGNVLLAFSVDGK